MNATRLSRPRLCQGTRNLQRGHLTRGIRRTALVIAGALLLGGVSGVPADDHAQARLKGADKIGPIRIENVSCKAAGAGAAAVTFDLAWDWSWRAAREVAPAQHGGPDPLKLASWDAAWVFAKFRQAGASIWSHATVSATTADHAAPPGATLAVGRSDDGRRGFGVFVYRSAPGSGPIDWKGVTLRWQHGADGVVDSGKVELKVLGLEVVYVPGGAFWVGDGATQPVQAQFSVAGGTTPFRIASEAALTLGGRDPKNLGNRDALGMFRAEDFGEVTRLLPAAFPKGYAPFYCMKRQITQGQYVAFLNLLTPAQQKLYGQVVAEGLKTAVAAQPDRVRELPRRGGVIRTVADPASAVYETDRPDAACAGLMCSEGVAFVAWAGLRPMTELEFEKAGRGPLKPAPQTDAGRRASGTRMAGRGPLKLVPGKAVSYWGIRGLTGPLAEQVIAVGNFRGRAFTGSHGDGATDRPTDWPEGFLGFGRRARATSDRYGMFGMPVLRSHNSRNGFRGVRTAPVQQ